MIKHLNKSFPISTTTFSNVRIIVFAGFFISTFIVFFKPFGLENINISNKNFILIGYGLVTSMILFINLILIKTRFKQIFNEEKWTILKNICWFLWIISTIGLANFIYTNLFFAFPFSIRGIVYFQIYTLIIGAIPSTVITLVMQNNYLKKNIKNANLISDNIEKKEKHGEIKEKIILLAENSKDKIELEVKNLLFIESAGNYVEVNYLENNKLKTKLLRSSLKRIYNSLINYPNLFKSHRAYIINTNNISNVKGNAQGYQISLINIDKKVPVSRNFISDFKKIIN